MTDLLDVLRFMGYGEVRTAAAGEWKPVSDVSGRLDDATTDDVHPIICDRWSPSCRLRDGDTGERVAVARSPESPER